MSAILRECGVVLAGSPEQHQQSQDKQQQQTNTRSSRSKDYRRGRERHRREPKSTYEREQSDMDFESSMHDMYETLHAQNRSSSRHKKAIRSMKEFLPFLVAEQSQVLQQQRYNAWLSIQSVKKTLQREFGIAEIRTSCGWAAVHLNATLMVLLKTLRKYTRAQQSSGGAGGSSLFTSSAFLRGACVDISAQASGIDFNDEYCIHLNPTDVPLQWIEVLERVDEHMLSYMQAARTSLETLQRGANGALGQGESAIVRGHTCPAIGYRAFLQAMAVKRNSRNGGFDEDDGWHNSVLETMTLVVEDRNFAWRVLNNGNVQVCVVDWDCFCTAHCD